MSFRNNFQFTSSEVPQNLSRNETMDPREDKAKFACEEEVEQVDYLL